MALDERISRRIKMSDLRMFLTVAEQGSMSKAAGVLNISQSAVSKALGALEHTLGVRLLDRSPQGVEPTLFGRALLDRGVAIFDELQQGVKDIEFLADPGAGEVRIGVGPPLVGFLFFVIEELSRRFPRMTFDVAEGDSAAIQNGRLRERTIDLMLGRIAPELECESFHSEVLFEDRVVIICGASNPLARRRKLKLSDLADAPWVVPPPTGLAGMRVMEIFHLHGLPTPHATVIASSTRLRDRLLATGRYLAISPAVEQWFNDNVTPLKVLPVEFHIKPRPIGVVTLKNRTLSGAAMTFIETARRLAKA